MEIKKTKHNAEKKILNIFYSNENIAFTHKQISSRLNIKDKTKRKEVVTILDMLSVKGNIKKRGRNKYIYESIKEKLITGKIEMIQAGGGYLISPQQTTDVFVKPYNTGKALHGDQVKAKIIIKGKRKKAQAQVIKVVRREKVFYTGIIQKAKKNAFLIPDSPHMHKDIFISSKGVKKAENGEKVLVKIEGWKEEEKNPHGSVVKRFGCPGEYEAEIESTLAEKGFNTVFPKKVLDQLEKIPKTIGDKEINKRKDFRKTPTFTIDPIDAKDFDDALSVNMLANNNYEIGIHIADVSSYLEAHSPLDKEAYKRGTSVYLVDKVVPMLPEQLSNDLCSLNPNQNKLCFSVVLEISKKAEIIKTWIGRTVINSNYRFTYEDAQKIIQGGKHPLYNEINELNNLAKVFRKKRIDRGAICFDKKEVRFKIDKNKNPIEVYFKRPKDAHRLVEEFMLLANKKVAEFLGKHTQENQKTKEGVYRVHDEPDIEKIQILKQFAKQHNYQIDTRNKNTLSRSINAMLDQVKEKPEKNTIVKLTIRSMAKAKYTTKNIGHYGLAMNYYSHFTSPIRRYPDVLVHRLLQYYLEGEKGANIKELEKQCLHSTEMEIKATEAERESIKFMHLKYMKDKVGETFFGVISGLAEWGIFVEVGDSGSEGLIRTKKLTNDKYYFDPVKLTLKGLTTHKQFKIGDKIKIIIDCVDLQKKQMDLSLC